MKKKCTCVEYYQSISGRSSKLMHWEIDVAHRVSWRKDKIVIFLDAITYFSCATIISICQIDFLSLLWVTWPLHIITKKWISYTTISGRSLISVHSAINTQDIKPDLDPSVSSHVICKGDYEWRCLWSTCLFSDEWRSSILLYMESARWHCSFRTWPKHISNWWKNFHVDDQFSWS